MHTPAIRDLESLLTLKSGEFRPLCLFSGGLDGTYLLYYLSTLNVRNVLALTVDLGGDLDHEFIENICRQLGATCLIIDRRGEFVEHFVVPSIYSQALYLGSYPISASLSRPLMAKAACEVASELGCSVIIHTSSRSQNSLRRFNGAFRRLKFDGLFGSPFDLSSIPRTKKISELSTAGIAFPEKEPCSTDSNLWCREFEYGRLDDPENIEVPEELYTWTQLMSNSSAIIKLTFQEGVPIEINGSALGVTEIVKELNLMVGSFGLGRYIGLEEIEDGAKVQELREMPAAFLLLDGYRRLESACVGSESIREKMHIEQLWVREAVEGRWYGDLRNAAQAFTAAIAQHVSGSITYELNPGAISIRSLQAKAPLYIRDRGTYERAAIAATV